MKTYRSNTARRWVLSLQRSGRIIRQGNMHPKVEIFRYVTEQTFDAYLFQLVESKQRFISQIMTSKSPVRSAEDVDEAALSYAEIKMLATGNPHIKEKMDLDIQVAKLKLLKQSHLSARYALEDKVAKKYPFEINALTQRIKGLIIDQKTVQEHLPNEEDGFSPMEINGVSYTKKADAGATLLEQCKTLDIKESATIGRYRGFEMILSFDTVYKEYHLTLKGALSHKVTLGMDELGNITRIENVLEGLNVKQVASELLLDTTKSELESAREEIKRPFPKEDELSEKSKRLDSLNILLNMDNQTTDIVDASAPAEEHPRKQRDAHER